MSNHLMGINNLVKTLTNKKVYSIILAERVCWNWQTGTFEGRVSMTYGFKSRHSHHVEAKLSFASTFFVKNSYARFLASPPSQKVTPMLLRKKDCIF